MRGSSSGSASRMGVGRVGTTETRVLGKVFSLSSGEAPKSDLRSLHLASPLSLCRSASSPTACHSILEQLLDQLAPASTQLVRLAVFPTDRFRSVPRPVTDSQSTRTRLVDTQIASTRSHRVRLSRPQGKIGKHGRRKNCATELRRVVRNRLEHRPAPRATARP